MSNRKKIVQVLFCFAFLFSCEKKKEVLPSSPPINSTKIHCPQTKLKQTHIVQLQGQFTVDAQTIVPVGEKPFPITLNTGDLNELNNGKLEILCRVLERRGIGVGTEFGKKNVNLPELKLVHGPGLKLARGKMSFHIPPAEHAAELLTNYEHSLDRLLESEY